MDTCVAYGTCGHGYVRVIVPSTRQVTTSTGGDNRTGGTGDTVDTGTLSRHEMRTLLSITECDTRLLIETALEAAEVELKVYGYAKFEEMIELIPIEFRPQSPYVRKAEVNSPDGRHATPDRGSGLWRRGGGLNF